MTKPDFQGALKLVMSLAHERVLPFCCNADIEYLNLTVAELRA